MKIIKASLRNALRRKWKFALVVFLFAVGLVVLTNVYDVVGAVERRVEFVEAVRNGDAVTREQVEATERDTGLMLFFAMLTYAFTLGTTVFAFVMPGGLVANERKSTAIMLWAQHPMPLTSFYLQRYAGIQVATVAALLIFDFTASLASLPSEVSVPEWEGVPSNCLLVSCPRDSCT